MMRSLINRFDITTSPNAARFSSPDLGDDETGDDCVWIAGNLFAGGDRVIQFRNTD
ncbi:MAG: hypothetical protein HC769_20435 [Cyanobacteria bacterium CRU_2_1]|nr:hypothetical protein [Cyanobacteria bacterium CRU_2_1]